MLKIYGKDKSGEWILLPYAQSLSLKRDLSAPCDLLELVFCGDIGIEVLHLELKDGDTFFRGIVDEQIVTFGTSPATKLVARSEEALLSDNEACPEIFQNPSFELIFERYAKPCGIEKSEGISGVYKGMHKVSKGMSCFEVIDTFCKGVYGVSPCVENRVLKLAKSSDNELVFTTEESGGIEVCKAQVSYLPCKLISCVNVKTSPDGNYNTAIFDEEAKATGICRQRYLDVSSLSAKSYGSAFELLGKARRKSCVLSLVCKGRFTDTLGLNAKARIFAKTYEGFVVSGVRYLRSKGKNETTVTLVKRGE